MRAFRIVIRVLGAVILTLGMLCLPAGAGASPKRDLSAFFRAADTGAFLWHPGLVLLAVGLPLLIVSFLLPPRGE